MSCRFLATLLGWYASMSLIIGATFAAGPKEVHLVAPTEAIPAEEQQKKFHLPPGFTIQLVAAEPDIRKPMNLNFDVRGRLYATQSEEYPWAAKPDAPHRDVIKRFDGIGADGRPGKVVTVVEGLNIPIGLLPRADGLIYYSIPDIFRAADPHHDDHYQPSKVLYGSFGFRDTHGMGNALTRWIDGWVYGCHGYANDSELRGADDHAVKMNSGNTYRFRADGSHIEQYTHGQVNPFGLAFDPLGNLYSADCHTKPLYMLLRGAWYPSFGKPHDGLGYGPEMIKHLHGSTGIAGVVYYAADQFPAEYRDTIFIGNPVTGCVNRDRLEPHGSTYKAVAQPDFISCDDPWFRPVDLKLGPDGALYIADFYNCIIGHYEVPLTHPRRDRSKGRIWRVVYTGTEEAPAAPARPMPDLTTLTGSQLAELLGDANLTVRVLAAEQLASLPLPSEDADRLQAALVAAGEDDATIFRRAIALWLVERLVPGGLTNEQIERLAGNPSRLVRVHLLKALAERADWGSTSVDLLGLTRERLRDDDPFVRRAAADALGRHPQADNVAPLLSLWAATPADDTHLIHVVRMALRDQLLVPGMYGLIADQLAREPADANRIADVSLGVRTSEAAAFLTGYVKSRDINDGPLAEYLHTIVRYSPDERFDDALRLAQSLGAGSTARQQAILLSAVRATAERGQTVPDEIVSWGRRLLAELLASSKKGDVKRGIELASELRFAGSYDQLAALASPGASFADLRAAAIDACVINDRAKAVSTLAAIIGDSGDEIAFRQKAATALAGLKAPETYPVMVEQLRHAPDQLAVEIARGLAIDAAGAEMLLGEIKAGRASAQLLKDRVVEARLSRMERMTEEVNRFTASLPAEDERVAKLAKARREGFAKATVDTEAGRAVFLKVCAACHKIGDQGAKIGPELHGVGLRGLDRLLEDTLDPNRNVDQAFRTTTLGTFDGRILTGLLLREEGEVLVLADAQGKEIRLPVDDVDERTISNLSPMPSNVADLISEPDFYNLIAFLLEQKQKTEPPPQAQP